MADLPKRISANENHPDYHPAAHMLEVLIDGEKTDYCETADAETGVAVIFEQDENGNIIAMPDVGTIRRKVVRGKVEIRLREGVEWPNI